MIGRETEDIHACGRDDIPSFGRMIYSPLGLVIYQAMAWIKNTRSAERVFLVETGGLEPLTPCMSSKYSNQLSYASVLALLLYMDMMRLSREKTQFA